MHYAVWVSIVTAAAGIGTALLTYKAAVKAAIATQETTRETSRGAQEAAREAERTKRLAALEHRQDVLEYRNRRLWWYCRALVDHIWSEKPPPPPPWPDDLDDDDCPAPKL